MLKSFYSLLETPADYLTLIGRIIRIKFGKYVASSNEELDRICMVNSMICQIVTAGAAVKAACKMIGAIRNFCRR